MAEAKRPASIRTPATSSSKPAPTPIRTATSTGANALGRRVNDRSSIPATAGTQSIKMLGRFRLISILGEGAMGKVVRAEDTSLKRQVALKLLPSPKEKTYRVEQFVREGRSAAALEHPNIVHIYEVGEAGGHHYIAMELIEGGSLAALLRVSGPLDVARACSLGAEAAEALAYAAQMGVVHRDVKPENLMLTRSGRCKLADFGLASIDDPSDGFRMPSESVGTPNYMAPEVVESTPATDKSDVYSLAAVMFFLLTGRVPFPGKTREDTLRAHVHTPAPDLRAIRPDVPEGLAKSIWSAMAKNPEHRPDASSFSRALRTYTIGSESSQSGGVSGVYPGTPGASGVIGKMSPPQSRWLFISIAIGLLAAGGLVTALLFLVDFMSPRSYGPTPAIRRVDAPIASAAPGSSIKPVASIFRPAFLTLLPGEIRMNDFINVSKTAGTDKVVTLVGTVERVVKGNDGGLILKFRATQLTARVAIDQVPAFEQRFGSLAHNLLKADVKIKSAVDYRGQPIISDLTLDALTVVSPVAAPAH